MNCIHRLLINVPSVLFPADGVRALFSFYSYSLGLAIARTSQIIIKQAAKQTALL